MYENLPDWEVYLRQFMPHIRLLGEIPITPSGHANMEALLHRQIKAVGLPKTTHHLEIDWPAVLAVYLAFKAAYNQEWNFWDGVADNLGVKNKTTFFMERTHWGKAYLQALAKFDLPLFGDVEAGHEYIPRIRLHGGVPAYSLPDLFAYILLPSVQRADWAVLEDGEALEALLATGTVQSFVDDPVQLFFKHGGEFALRFFSKCRRMARLVLNDEQLPSAAELGLRPYVVESFDAYWNRQVEHGSKKVRRRWKAPRIWFSPYEPAYRLSLPEQVIPLESAGKPYAWRIISDQGDEQFHKVRLFQPGREVLARGLELTLDDPWRTIGVEFSAGGDAPPSNLKRTWRFRLLPDPEQPPLMAYRYPDGLPLRIGGALPAQALWLLYPADAELHFGGSAACIEKGPSYWSPWDSWQAVVYDLRQAQWVQVMRAGQSLCAPIPIEASLNEPILLGDNTLAASLSVDDKPLYLGVPPTLRLPRQPGQTIEQALRRWQLHLEARFAASPAGEWSTDALVSAAYLSVEDEAAIMLPLQDVLGERPIGTYHLTCQGPDRTESDLPFRVWPNLDVIGLQPYYLPEPQKGAQLATFEVHIQLNQVVLAASPTEGVTVERIQDGIYSIAVSGEHNQADLIFETQTEKAEVIQVPVRLAVPRLRWALRLNPGDPIEWQTQPIARPLAEVLQSALPQLHIELPHHGLEELLIALKLVDPESAEDLHSADTQKLHKSQERLHFPLGVFRDTLRAQTQRSYVAFDLEWLDPLHENILNLTLLRMTQALDVSAVWMQAQPDGGWCIHWQEHQPLRHRHIFLWSEWQPWADSVDIPIPDDPAPSDSAPDSDWWMIPIPEEYGLPPSWYRIFFTVVPPFERVHLPAFPLPDAIRIEALPPRKRLQQIESDLVSFPKRAYAAHFERVCLYDSAGDIESRDAEIQWCLSNWHEALPIYLLTLHNWLAQRDSITQRAIRMFMFRGQSLEKLKSYQASSEILGGYLAAFEDAKTVNPSAVELVLQLSDDPPVVIHALNFLLKSTETVPNAVEYILLAMQAGRFADQDACELLLPVAPQAIQVLVALPRSPDQERLLLNLVKQAPQPDIIVLPGYWVRSDAGWGRIDNIQASSGREEKAFFFPGQEQPVLQVTLRSTDKYSERVELDLTQEQCIFLENNQLHLCTKNGCEHFISANLNVVQNQHNRAAHGGLGPSWRSVQNPIRLRKTLEYRAGPPPDSFV